MAIHLKKEKEPKNSHEDELIAASPVLSWAVKHFIHFFFPREKKHSEEKEVR